MHYHTNSLSNFRLCFCTFSVTVLSCCLILASCKEKTKPEEKVIVKFPQKMDDKVKDLIGSDLSYTVENGGKIDDTTILYQLPALVNLYKQKRNEPLWSSTQKWKPQGDSLLKFIEQARLYGLFPSDYHAHQLLHIKKIFETDIWKEKETRDAALWSRADLMLSDALISIFHDVKLGRLPQDSITLRKDSVLHEDLIEEKFNAIISGLSLDSVIATLEPKIKGYRELKDAVKNFLESANFSPIETIVFPNKNQVELRSAVVKRLFETGYIDSSTLQPDSLKLAAILKKYQKDKRLAVDGKIGGQTVRMLNLSDAEKFNRIAITMDRYKMLPDTLPQKYIWVNIPSYTLRLVSNDTLVLSSKVVVGKPQTRTPVLTSAVSDMITYPQWNIPQSIIMKEIVPGLKKDTNYLAKKGYSLLNGKNEEVSPGSVNWSKFSKDAKSIPYKVIQGSGDDNALGVLKFNFPNKYAVYMHDTNQRSFFGFDSRAFSHGCVRVQDWAKMAIYIMNNDSIAAANSKWKPTPLDSLNRWLAVKEKHSIPIRARLPVFIRYFTCEANNGRISFFEDIYDEDKNLTELLFANKKNGK